MCKKKFSMESTGNSSLYYPQIIHNLDNNQSQTKEVGINNNLESLANTSSPRSLTERKIEPKEKEKIDDEDQI